MEEKVFGNRVAELRAQKNVSAREMSLAIGQNESYINRIENGKCFPSMQGFFYICEYFDITPQEFFDTSMKVPSKTRELITLIKKLNPSELEALSVLLSHWK